MGRCKELGKLYTGANSMIALKSEEWEQGDEGWYHKKCDAYSDKYHCPMCGVADPSSFTWGDIEKHIREQGYDKDEYFGWNWSDNGEYINRQVWNGTEDWYVAVWWSPGGSEGWYVHVDRLWTEKGVDDRFDYRCGKTILLGKFWSMERAQEVTQALTEYIYK